MREQDSANLFEGNVSLTKVYFLFEMKIEGVRGS